MNQPDRIVKIHKHGRFVVDREPFFPIGLYSVPHEERFGELCRAGFNTVHSYEFERVLYLNLQSRQRDVTTMDGLGDKAADRYLHAAAEHGLKVIMGFNRPDGHEPGIFSDVGLEQMGRRVLALREHPALLGWYLVDEPDGQAIATEAVRQAQDSLKSLDPHHPTLTVLCVPDKFKDYAGSATVLMHDPYPIPRKPLQVVSRNLKKLKTIVGPDRAIIAVLQAFDWKSYDWKAEGTRAPTLQELRCMTYQAIVSNVSGILYFNYHNELHSNRPADNPEGWAALSSVAAELQHLTPALLAPPADAWPVKGNIGVTYRRTGRETWVLAVNSKPQPCRVTFGLPQGTSRATILNDLSSPACVECCGQFEVQFEPYGVRAFRIQVPP